MDLEEKPNFATHLARFQSALVSSTRYTNARRFSPVNPMRRDSTEGLSSLDTGSTRGVMWLRLMSRRAFLCLKSGFPGPGDRFLSPPRLFSSTLEVAYSTAWDLG